MEYTERDEDLEGDGESPFHWDDANELHVAEHGVTPSEAEEIFDDPGRVFLRRSDSPTEHRWVLLGRTFAGRLQVIVYTRRNGRIRVITVRDPNVGESRFWSRRRG